MKLIRILRDGIATNEWTDDVLPETHYEPCFGKPERWVRESELNLYGEDASKATESREVTLFNETFIELKFEAEYAVEVVDISAQIEAQKRIEYGRAAQAFGADMIAFIHSVNESKDLTPAQFNAIMANTAISNIERLLWNGSLVTARNLIQTLPEALYSAAEIAVVVGMINGFLAKHGKL